MIRLGTRKSAEMCFQLQTLDSRFCTLLQLFPCVCVRGSGRPTLFLSAFYLDLCFTCAIFSTVLANTQLLAYAYMTFNCVLTSSNRQDIVGDLIYKDRQKRMICHDDLQQRIVDQSWASTMYPSIHTNICLMATNSQLIAPCAQEHKPRCSPPMPRQCSLA